ncbi:MAG: hypothetical protein IT226_01710 [Flavobacteriales bacterium]|nr:hypothetical protein [Flavobacteriales bacterium]
MLARTRRSWPILLFAAIVSGLVAGAIRWFVPARYASTIVLYVAGPPSHESMTGGLPVVSPRMMRVFHAATSTEVLVHLLDTYDLQAHYGIAQNIPGGRTMAMQRLLTSIEPRYLDEQCMSVTVHDLDQGLAVVMANAIHDQLQTIVNRDEAVALERTVAVFGNVLHRTEQRTTERADRLAALLARKLLDPAMHVSGSNSEAELLRAVDMLAAVETPSIELQRVYDIAAEMLSIAGPPQLILVRSAMPDISNSTLSPAIIVALLTAIAVFIIGTTLILLWHFHGKDIHLWLTTPMP